MSLKSRLTALEKRMSDRPRRQYAPGEQHRLETTASLFHVLTEVSRLLQLAHEKHLEWRAEMQRPANADGSPGDAYEIRIRIGPKVDPLDTEWIEHLVREEVQKRQPQGAS